MLANAVGINGYLRICIGWISLFCVLPTYAQTNFSAELLAGIQARSIGPAGMSGRVAAIDVAPNDPNTIYVGAATGGVWKSTNGGTHWESIFDQADVHAIGAIAVSPSNPDVIWAGTGEGNIRNSISIGRGIYRSLDAGRTWQNMGLTQSERIHRIIVHPRDPDTVYVAALGQAWGDNAERGVFRSRDGGKTWKKILYVDAKTGAADLVMDPRNPDKLFASMWTYRRWPWLFESGGSGSGIFLTTNGGEDWRQSKLADGLPKGELGRIGIAISASEPRVVYALVEAAESALLRSDDGGYHWRSVNTELNVSSRPFYYADIRVHPKNPDQVYRLATFVDRSIDGGKTFQGFVGIDKLHPDNHALWIDQNNPDYMINGNDGGIGITRDGGVTWRFVNNLPLAQFYHVRYDMETPYNLYGGLQDNGSWRGPSSRWEQGPIRNAHWVEVGFGDGFDTSPDPENPMRGYAMSQDGHVLRWDLQTGERYSIRPASPDPKIALRFNWNAAFAQDPFNPARIYFGSQFLHRSDDRGDSWQTISPDLTSNNPEKQKSSASGGLTPDVTAAENHTTLVAIAPSAIQKDLIWVGTDDGRVQVTQDAGKNWINVAAGVRGVPADSWVPHISPSPHEAGTAFVVFDDHRRADMKPHLYRVDDYGARWTSLATDEIDGYALVLIQDPVNPQLLFLGTELGLYFSIDAGRHWGRWTHGLPTASVMDLAIHPREHDLIVATHGRALFVIDDIRPLRALSSLQLDEPLHVFEVAPTIQYQIKPNVLDTINAQSEFRGENRAYGALISFYLRHEDLPHPDPEKERVRQRAVLATADEVPASKAGIEIRDSAGVLVDRFEAEVKQGLNRVVWDLNRFAYRSALPPSPWGGATQAPVVPGTYQVRVVFREQSQNTNLTVLADPRLGLSTDDYAAKARAWQRLGAAQEAITDSIRRIQDLRATLELVSTQIQTERDRRRELAPAEVIPKDDPQEFLMRSVTKFKEELLAVEKSVWQPPESTRGYVAATDAQSQLGTAAEYFASSLRPPSPVQMAYLEIGERTTQAAVEGVEKLFNEALPKLRQQLNERGFVLALPMSSSSS